MNRRLATFQVSGDFGGAGTATVTVRPTGPHDAILSVRPYWRHRTFDMRLSQIANLVIERVEGAEARGVVKLGRGRIRGRR